MLAIARERAPADGSVTLQIGDAIAPDFPEATFDAVVSRHVIWTLRDPEAAFRNWLRVLRPGARFVAIDAFWFTPGDPSEPRDDSDWREPWQRYYSDETRAGLPAMPLTDHAPLIEMARAAGFVDVSVTHLTSIREAEAEPIGNEPRYALIGYRPT
jgi:SAM-dependent methyltransferase